MQGLQAENAGKMQIALAAGVAVNLSLKARYMPDCEEMAHCQGIHVGVI